MTTNDVKRVFWKDVVVVKSYSIGCNSTINVLSFNRKTLNPLPAIFQNCITKTQNKELVKSVATSLVSVQILRTIRPVSLSLAIASSCASDVFMASVLTTKSFTIRVLSKILSSALLAGVQYSTEYALFARTKNTLKTKTKNDFATAFVAGCMASAATNVAVCMLPSGRRQQSLSLQCDTQQHVSFSLPNNDIQVMETDTSQQIHMNVEKIEKLDTNQFLITSGNTKRIEL